MSAKLIYIVAAGHSGSTLLDMLIGSIPGVFSTGEFNYLPWQLSRSEPAGPDASPQKLCSCGQGFHECTVWQKILNEVSESAGFDIYADPFSFKMNLLQNEKFFAGRFSCERLNRAIYTLACRHHLLSPITRAYRYYLADAVRNNWMIFDAITSITQQNFIVDSSKSALRLKLLHESRPQDTFAIILMRDINGVSYSQQKLGLDPVSAARGWVNQYNRIYSVLQSIKGLNVLGVRYENLAADPAGERQRIASFLGYSTIYSDVHIDTTKLHLVAGNRSRYSGDIDIHLDQAWKEGLSDAAQARIMQIRADLNSKWDPLFAT
jgi:hypothetical protein